MTSRPRQRDIARLAGVSQTTVSLALNGKTAEHGINKETEQKIMAAAQQLGYVPNITARALRGGRNRLIGVHAFEPLFPTSRESYYDEIMVGIEQQAIRSGQDLVLFTSMHQDDGPANIFHEGRNRLRIADGAIILGFDEHDDELARLAAEGFPFVFVGRREKAAALMPYVSADYVRAVSELTRHVHELGHRRVAYLGLDDQAVPRIERRHGFHQTCTELGITVADETLAEPGGLDHGWLERVLHAGATAVLAEGTAHLEEIAALCAERHVAIPDRLSIVGLDSINDSMPVTHQWTHLTVPRLAMGARAVELLLEVLEGQHELTYHEDLACGFEAGATLAQPH
ncbi:LacI family DNA-binding transcriptional regulator [Phytoactinopolyspora halotolerans]|uniref:LacI family transcriptional regulator n=1 Tax=Phytoactinopolyspora halotolerans TaxID=1981512 RepID=A0A6L9SKW5_9ACTN|nr:LacI family DNA-binding transcriptional regulator [Phytoactinopolyspora halotolerans]NEE04720.1 LacI family transcriptional regulator [Phytoactinopolyspora halotolerans]